MAQYAKADTDQTRRLQRNPLEWVLFFFPESDQWKWSDQQKEAWVELGKIIRAKLNKAEGLPLTDEDKEYVNKIGMSIQSGNGTGKDTFIATTILFFTHLFPDPKNSATANTAKQLRNVLWSEIAKMLRRICRKATPESKYTLLEEVLELQSEKLFLKEFKGEIWFTEAVTVNTKLSEDEQAEAIAGRHENIQLFAIDEGSNIANAVYKKIERTLTRMLNLMIIIYNPTRAKGYAIDSQTDARFVSLRWSAEDSHLVTKEHIANQELKYGRDSNSFRISVLGLPPKTDKNVLIPWEWIEDACEREIIVADNDCVIKALDCGGGGDPSIIGTRKGHRLHPFKNNNSEKSEDVVDWAIDDFVTERAHVEFVDQNGIGHGIFGEMRRRKGSHKIKGIMNQERADDEHQFANKRTESFWHLREAFESKQISLILLEPHQQTEIKKQLGAIKLIEGGDRQGRKQLAPKREVKKELGGDSPDEADTLAMMYCKKEQYLQQYRPYDDYDQDNEEEEVGTSWMGV